jgi:D-alanine-D-alanine ligase
MNRYSVAVLMGGTSAEREISVATGKAVIRNLDPDRYRVIPTEIGPNGDWVILSEDGGNPVRRGDPSLLLADRPDLAFIALHGPMGEDGTIQGLLEVFGVPYTGSGVLASAAALHKPTAKILFQNAGLTPVPWQVVHPADWEREGIEALALFVSEHGFPLITKPVDLGSSFGVTLVRTEAELRQACETALRYSACVLLEKFIPGREIQCGVLANASSDEALVLPPTEIIPSGDFFDYRNKYTPGVAQEITPAPLTEKERGIIRENTLRAHRSLGCDGLSRVDMILSPESCFVLEVNTIPGMTETSLCPQQAEAAGIGFSGLLDRMIDLALARFEPRGQESRPIPRP